MIWVKFWVVLLYLYVSLVLFGYFHKDLYNFFMAQIKKIKFIDELGVAPPQGNEDDERTFIEKLKFILKKIINLTIIVLLQLVLMIIIGFILKFIVIT